MVPFNGYGSKKIRQKLNLFAGRRKKIRAAAVKTVDNQFNKSLLGHGIRQEAGQEEEAVEVEGFFHRGTGFQVELRLLPAQVYDVLVFFFHVFLQTLEITFHTDMFGPYKSLLNNFSVKGEGEHHETNFFAK